MQKLGQVLDAESYEWLDANYPEVRSAVEAEVKAKHTPEEIRRFVLRHTSRYEFSVRCEAAARHLVSGTQ